MFIPFNLSGPLPDLTVTDPSPRPTKYRKPRIMSTKAKKRRKRLKRLENKARAKQH